MERDDTAQPSQRRNSIDATDDASSDMANMELNSNSSSNPPINIGDCPLTPTRQNTTNTVDDTSRTQSNHVSSINFIRRPVINPYLRQRPPRSNSPNVFAHLISELRTIDSPSAERCQDTTPSQLPTTVVMLNQDVAPSSQSTVLPVVTQTQEVPPPLPHNNSNPSAQQTLQASPPPLPPPLYSSIDYETMEESFPTTIPQRRRDIIINTMKKVWKIDCPREFQIQAIYLMVYCREQVLYLIRKTGEGKSIVFLTIATLLRGITIVLVPLIGLGSDQVTKSINLSHRVESYHVDENKEASFTLLRKRLLSIPPRVRQTSSIILFCSPQSLLKNTAYNKLLRSLASKQLITTIVCDEAHTIPHDGVTFRPEFQEAIKELVSISPNVNFMACSATFGQSDQDKLTNITGKLPTSVYWGEMSRRNIQIVVEIHGQTKLQIKNKLMQDYAKDPFQKVLLYTNSKMNAQDSLTPMAQSVLKSLNIKGEVISFTGDDGIKMKSFVMHSFCREYTEEELVMHDEASLGLVDYASVHDTTKEDTPNVLIVPGTSSMNAGISSKYCKRAYRNGAPPRKLDFVQEMGRVDRDHKAEPGSHKYVMYLNFNLIVNLFIRHYREKRAIIRKYHLDNYYDLLSFVLLPTQCYHIVLEKEFEREIDGYERKPCGDLCPFCNKQYKQFTGTFRKNALVNLMLTDIFNNGKTSLVAFMKTLSKKENKIKIFGSENANDKVAGHIHALGIQLIASRIVEFEIDSSLIGTTQLEKSNIYLKLNVTHTTDNERIPTHMIENSWVGFNCI